MSEDKATRPTVSSVGNSWTVCKSNSRPGYVYYFNTLTGQAVWNLSDTEIEKAKLKTLESQINDTPIPPHPEPKEDPPIKKVINEAYDTQNGFTQITPPKDTYPDMNFTIPKKDSIPECSNMSNISAFDVTCINNPLNTINVISSPAVYNTNAWPMSRTHHIFLAPPVSVPYLNQSQNTLNFGYNQIMPTNELTPFRFNHYQNAPSRRNDMHHFKNKLGRGRRNFNRFQINNDLRQQLYTKRRLGKVPSQINTCLIEGENNESTAPRNSDRRTADVSTHIAEQIEEDFNTHETDHSVDKHKNMVSTCVEDMPISLDLTPLKCLAPSNAKKDIWYIVVDLRVLLQEYIFLNTLMNSDTHCRLMVPENVMSELKDYIACTNNIPARRMLYSVSEKIKSGCAFIADKPSEDFGDPITCPVLKTCLELFEKDYYVILITNDNKLLNYKKFIKINIFSVDDIKSILEISEHKEKLLSQPIVQTSEPSPQQNVIKIAHTTPVKTIDTEPVFVESNEDTSAKSIASALKYTADAAIQTETVTLISHEDTNAKVVQSQNQNIVESLINNSNTPKVTDNSETTTTRQTKRREIKLKRSVTNLPLQSTPIVTANEKKPFRWRRKRNQTNDLATNNVIDKPVSYSKVASVPTTRNSGSLNANFRDEQNDNYNNSNEMIQSKESSIIFMNTGLDKTTIEETSSSGIISNTDSNIDAEMYYNNFENNNINDHVSEENNSKIVMFEIDSETMAESLQANCEEWVSRFIQIMEEVLSVVLRKEPAFRNVEFPPPWTLHEAAQCIGKYSNNATIKHVTDELSLVLFRLSDDSGNITRNMAPCQYIKMYSYGVSLLNAVKDITTSCEDIQIAEKSLEKLLIDIKKPNYDLNDPINEPQEDIQNVLPSENKNEDDNCESPKEKIMKLKEKKQVNYNLRSRGSIMKTSEEQPLEFIENVKIKTQFFSNLNLQEVSLNTSFTETNTSDESREENNDKTRHKRSNDDAKDEVDNNSTANVKVTQSIVRNFSKCPEFEERLKNQVNLYDDHDLDYDDEYDSTEENDESYLGTELSDPNVTQILDTSDIEIPENLVTSSPKPAISPAPVDSNSTFKFMMCMFLEEVKNAINEVKLLCDKCYSELKNPQLAIAERNNLKKRLENAHSHIVGLSMSLKSMVDQNPKARTDNLLTVLKKAGVDLSEIDKGLVLKYWNTIAEWKKHTDVFLYSIEDIITTFNAH